MNEKVLSVFYRPWYQQCLVFTLLSVCICLLAIGLHIVPEWRRWQKSEQQYLLQSLLLNKQFRQAAAFPSPDELRHSVLAVRQKQSERSAFSLEALLSKSKVTIKHWQQSDQSVELLLSLGWPDVGAFFRQISLLHPFLPPGNFSIETSEEALEMRIRMNEKQ